MPVNYNEGQKGLKKKKAYYQQKWTEPSSLAECQNKIFLLKVYLGCGDVTEKC